MLDTNITSATPASDANITAAIPNKIINVSPFYKLVA